MIRRGDHMDNKTIMIVEDEMGIREITRKYLVKKGYEVTAVKNGEEAIAVLHSALPDLILLDIEMPGMNGFTVCQKVREEMNIPIIFLTVRRGTLDKVKCFELGGDDYVTKPFEFEELEARIQANLRRYYTYPQTQTNILKYENIEIHLHNYECYLNGELIELSTKEMELLIHLVKHPGQVWSKEQLFDQIWGLDAMGNIDTVRVHISYLRRKLEEKHTNLELIKTVHGFGYVFSG